MLFSVSKHRWSSSQTQLALRLNSCQNRTYQFHSPTSLSAGAPQSLWIAGGIQAFFALIYFICLFACVCVDPGMVNWDGTGEPENERILREDCERKNTLGSYTYMPFTVAPAPPRIPLRTAR